MPAMLHVSRLIETSRDVTANPDTPTANRCDQLRRYRRDQIIDAREVGLRQEAQHEKVRCRCGDRSFVYVVGRARW
jgi:hypothetical protein